MTLLALRVIKTLGVRQRLPNFGARGGLSPTVLRRCCDYMMEHLSEDISLADLGGLAGLSPGHLTSAFKRSVGIPPHTWLCRKRIAKAKELLRDLRLDIGSTASCVGYGNQSAFGIAFKRDTGRTPTSWRRNL